jgi:hypothetical protein
MIASTGRLWPIVAGCQMNGKHKERWKSDAVRLRKGLEI